MNPRVYVGTYAKYNAGNLSGEWLYLDDYTDKEDFLEACKKLHEDEADPEFMFQSCEDMPPGMCSEASIEKDAFEFANLNEHEQNIWMLAREHLSDEITLEQAQDAYCGSYSSPEDYAQNSFEQSYEIPEIVASYVDWKRVAGDLKCDYTFVQTDYKTCHVFRNDG